MRETCVVVHRCRHWHRPVMSQFQVLELVVVGPLGHPSLGPPQTTFVSGVPGLAVIPRGAPSLLLIY
ncbi:hypothetical protein L208DRAFT_1383609 [Tricholoma matsutake]|nr:hypothetical protein L208DRAFT_1383609 [Tricholoma matsutake 945]